MLLAVDTSIGTAVAVVDESGRVAAEAASENALGHAELIGDLIERVLAEADIAPADVTRVAVGMGPGPFTGLRVGIATARAFALGRGVPVVPVPSHDAAALTALEADPARGPRIAIVTDARRRERAYSIYDGIDPDGIPVRVSGPALAPNDDVDGHLSGARRVDALAVSAAAVGRLAVLAQASGRVLGDDSALYLRAPDVTLGGGRKKVIA